MRFRCNRCLKEFDVAGRIRKDGCKGANYVIISRDKIRKKAINCPFCKTHNIRPCR